MAISYVSSLKDLKVRWVQADETWSFVAAKQKNVPRMKRPCVGAGTIWAYLAVCGETKFILTYLLGDRRVPDATAFMKSVEAKLAKGTNGQFITKPLIVTDGLNSYREAGDVSFGDAADRAMIVKQYSNLGQYGETTPASRYFGSEKQTLAGSPVPQSIHTAYIERVNLTLRMGNKKYTRKSNAISKTLRNHERQLAIWIMYYNFCLLPSPKRKTCVEIGEIYWQKRLTPAMEVGLTDRVWTVGDILQLAGADSARVRRSASSAKDEANQHESDILIERSPYCVFTSDQHHAAKVHKAECSSCRGDWEDLAAMLRPVARFRVPRLRLH